MTEKENKMEDKTSPAKKTASDSEIYNSDSAHFRRLLARKVCKTAGLAALLRFTIKLLFKKLNLLKALRELMPIV